MTESPQSIGVENFKSSTARTATPLQSAKNEVDDVSNNLEYRFEQNRLNSYVNWRCRYVHPEDLARAGFYYTGQIDRVRCFECRTEICRWEEGDDPETEHKRWSGRCRLIRGKSCGNVPIGVNPDNIEVTRPRSRDVCGPYRLNYRMDAEADTHMPLSASPQSEEQQQQQQQLPSAAALGSLGFAIAKRPDFPDYTTYEVRLQTFANWPTSMVQTKEQLADAGFFYTGTGDHTTCFQCGGGLKNWEPQDDPWVQHAKWFSTCFYIKLRLGQEFINNVTGKMVPPPSEEEISRMKLPSCIKKVESSVPQKCELVEESTPNENTAAGPSSTECPTPKPRTMIQVQRDSKESTVSTNCNSVAKPEESQQSSERKPVDSDARLCKICYNEELGILFVPCGHIVTCVKCAPGMTTCALCRKKIDLTVRAYFS
ncbi:baculoviral IAP repeat-containing protein 8-like isoform X2 [Phymastichus coffea]|nr:baculoviral IAP repeat-containing protein 8-like isoform X2 [Phymastichus coffea]XP_058810809.1 baculoviral IAP repeat-containing protein 8-like isoform X2 [Phymastichus coffea]